MVLLQAHNIKFLRQLRKDKHKSYLTVSLVIQNDFYIEVSIFLNEPLIIPLFQISLRMKNKPSKFIEDFPYCDTLCYSVKLSHQKASKQTFLSQITKLFDFLVLLGSVILHAKIIMQLCWKSGITLE